MYIYIYMCVCMFYVNCYPVRIPTSHVGIQCKSRKHPVVRRELRSYMMWVSIFPISNGSQLELLRLSRPSSTGITINDTPGNQIHHVIQTRHIPLISPDLNGSVPPPSFPSSAAQHLSKVQHGQQSARVPDPILVTTALARRSKPQGGWVKIGITLRYKFSYMNYAIPMNIPSNDVFDAYTPAIKQFAMENDRFLRGIIYRTW